MKAPTMKNAPARAQARERGELLREVYSNESKRGFLLNVRETGGRLVVEIYAAEPGVYVRIGGRDFKAPR